MKKNVCWAACILSASLWGSLAMAQEPASVPGRWELTPALTFSETFYKHGDVTRQMLGLRLERTGVIFDRLNLAADFGYAFKSEHSEWNKKGGSGSGYAMGLESSFAPFRALPGLRGGLRLFRFSEDYGDGGRFGGLASAEGDATGVSAGLMYSHALSKLLSAHAAVEYVVFEDGTYGRSIGGLTVGRDQDMERDSKVGLRLGAAYDAGGYRIKADIALISEQSVKLGVGIPF